MDMKILALEKELPGETARVTQPLLKDEARRIWKLQQSGAIREIYFDSNQHTAVLVLECAHIAEAQGLLATLPLVMAGLIEFELIPLVPYDGLARLFAECD
jgi:hypothetical protein